MLGAKGIASSAELHGVMEDMDMRGRKALGARIVARAWVDPAFKARLLADAAAAAAELGIASSNFPPAPGKSMLGAVHGVKAGLTLCVPRPRPHNCCVPGSSRLDMHWWPQHDSPSWCFSGTCDARPKRSMPLAGSVSLWDMLMHAQLLVPVAC